jgi:cytochrome P450
MFNPQSLMAPRTMQERYSTYRTLRQVAPVLAIPGTNLWFLFRYDDVRSVISDPNTFSSDIKYFAKELLASNPDQLLSLQSIIGIDPPMHHKMRSLIARAFTPRVIEQYEDKIRSIVNGLLDAVIETGHIDVIHDLGEPLPTKVIADMLGIEPEFQDEFRRASEILLQADISSGKPDPAAGPAEKILTDYMYDLIARRRAQPEDDLTSALIAAEIDGERLSEREIVSFCELLLIAGNGTTTHLIGNMMLALMENPDELARLRQDPTLMMSAIEEALRYYSPSQTVLRSTTREVTLSGQTIPAGARIMPILTSANRDETKFADADRFDITRQLNQHIAFGNGIHYCLGGPLARLEARIAFEAMLERLPNLELDADAALAVNPGVLINSLKSLPLHFTPGVQTINA